MVSFDPSLVIYCIFCRSVVRFVQLFKCLPLLSMVSDLTIALRKDLKTIITKKANDRKVIPISQNALILQQ